MRRVLLACLVAVVAISTTAISQNEPRIEVIYPLPNQRIAAVDSTFIFGNVTPGSTLKINQTEIKVYENGAFLAFLPIRSGRFTFNLLATLKGKQASKEIPLDVPEPYVVPESLAIVKGFMTPTSNATMMAGDMFVTNFRGTSGLNGYFRLSNRSQLIRMAESAPTPQSYWAQSVFGSGEIPDSLMVKGSYNGQIILGDADVGDTASVVYYLCRKPLSRLSIHDSAFSRDLKSCDCVQRTNDARLNVWPADTIVVGELTDSVQTLRVGPRKGYFSVYQPRGIRLRVTGYTNGHYRALLAGEHEIWITDSSMSIQPSGSRIPSGEFALIRTQRVDGGALVTFNPGAALPFDVDYDPSRKRIDLDIFNCTSSIDWVRYDPADSLIASIDFEQVRAGQVKLSIQLTQPLWGYDCSYKGNQFNFKLNSRPPVEGKLKGLNIVVDPGHSPDPGAIGPGGYKEKDANLAIAIKLRELLEKDGATVHMTRADDSPVALYDRPKLSYGFDADIFVSVHNNALPDGVNPFTNNGTSCFYYHPQSQALAASVHRRMVDATKLTDYGLWHGNFAVIRPTGYLAILVECAFMMIPEQEMSLQTDEFREQVARAITDGIVDFVEADKSR